MPRSHSKMVEVGSPTGSQSSAPVKKILQHKESSGEAYLAIPMGSVGPESPAQRPAPIRPTAPPGT